ncbi:MAG: DUF1788 domain-containing protein [Bacillota bacterium]|nr:DUF1788 domain-containing protein [Bacillota bacterium]
MKIGSGPMHERYRHLLAVITSERFLKLQGIGNEVPFFICPYKPDEELVMQSLQKQLREKASQEGLNILHINLYDLSIELLKERGLWEQILEMEPEMSKAELLETLDGVLDCKSNLIPAIAVKINQQPPDVLFISGIGEVFPYIRTHNLLENMQSTAKGFPSVFFFPGTYSFSVETGAYLDLFDRLHANKYYRAFDIYNYEV